MVSNESLYELVVHGSDYGWDVADPGEVPPGDIVEVTMAGAAHGPLIYKVKVTWKTGSDTGPQ